MVCTYWSVMYVANFVSKSWVLETKARNGKFPALSVDTDEPLNAGQRRDPESEMHAADVDAALKMATTASRRAVGILSKTSARIDNKNSQQKKKKKKDE